jgi:gluconolactonase
MNRQNVPAPLDIVATPFTTLPHKFHHRGEPNEWVRTTRPGQRLHSFIEGPCFDAQGDLWLVDVPYGRIFKVSPDGAWNLVHQYDGEPHGLALLPDGRFAIADYRHGLLALDPPTNVLSPLCERVNTERFRGLGDVTTAPNGDIWFTDPGRSSLTDPTGRVFRLPKEQTRPELVLQNVPYPNGVALSRDGKLVYLSVTRANAVWRLLADAPDPVYPMVGTYVQLSGGLGPDGLATDASGRLAVAHAQAGRVWLFDKIGDPIARIRTPGGLWTTSAAFTPDGKELIMLDAETATIFRVSMDAVSDE